MSNCRTNSADKIKEQKFFRPPNILQRPTKHPQAKHVEKNMYKISMGKHMCEDLVGPEVFVFDRP